MLSLALWPVIPFSSVILGKWCHVLFCFPTGFPECSSKSEVQFKQNTTDKGLLVVSSVIFYYLYSAAGECVQGLYVDFPSLLNFELC